LGKQRSRMGNCRCSVISFDRCLWDPDDAF
jgi:hypothetical protein